MSKGSRPRPLSVSQKEFDSNWDKIFNNKKSCPCGRSPTSRCVGWHGLTEEQLTRARQLWAERDQGNS